MSGPSWTQGSTSICSPAPKQSGRTSITSSASLLEVQAFINLRKVQGLIAIAEREDRTLVNQAAAFILAASICRSIPKRFRDLLAKLRLRDNEKRIDTALARNTLVRPGRILLHSYTGRTPMTDHLIQQLRALKLSGMREHLEARIQEAERNDLSYDEFLSMVISDEVEMRTNRTDHATHPPCRPGG